MPVMDGIEATRRIKQGRPDVGIVAFSAAGEAALVEKVIAAGAYARVDKEDLIGLLHALQELAERVPVGAAPVVVRPTALDVWTSARRGLAAALASFGTFTRSLGGAQVAGALGIGGAAALATIMLLITVSPGGRDPSNVIRPEIVFGPTAAPQVGSIELDGDFKVAKERDRKRSGGVDTAPVVTVEVAAVETAPREAAPATPPAGNDDGRGDGPGSNGGNGPGNDGQTGAGQPHNGGPDGPPGNGPQGDQGGPPVSAKPKNHGPPGLAKKPGGMPPGQAKKQGHGSPAHKEPPGHAKSGKTSPGHQKKSHPGKGKGKH